ncbi:MAG: DUF2207 domain-containing protein [Clostridia bacterium]|nr:DUF2207 domain-containing protein [Clostridia bacterium]
MSEFSVFLASMILLGLFTIFCIAVDLASYARRKNVIKPVEFYAPKGFSPIDVALVYSARGLKAGNMLNPLLLYWADQGYVKIDDDGRGLKITRVKWLPPFDESGRVDKKTYDCEQSLFTAMFTGNSSSDGKVFYTLAARKSMNDTYDEAIGECKKMSRSVVGKKGKKLSLIMKFGAVVVAFLVGVLASFLVSMPIVLCMLFPVIGAFLIKFMPAPFYIRVPFMLVWGGVPLVAMLFMFPMGTLLKISVGMAVLVLVLTISIFAEKADFREEEDLKIYGKVCSFKRFLTVADKARLEALVEENPDYFFDVLPYFYVFGITKKMKKKFDKIIPDGSFRFLGGIRDVYID